MRLISAFAEDNVQNVQKEIKDMERITVVIIVIAAGLVAGIACLAQSGTGVRPLDSQTSALEKMPKDLEIRFALSALPPHLRDAATVYLLDPKSGYVLDHKGSNGFSCVVERTEWARAEFRSDIYTALCYDEEGSRNHLRVYMDTAAMRAKGMTADAVKKEITRRFADGTYTAPKRMGLSYMLAPLMLTYPNPNFAHNSEMTMSMPHYMIY